MRKNERKATIDIVGKCFTIILLALLIVYCVSLLVPLIWLLLSSFKEFDDYLLSSFGFPKSFRWQNYAEVFDVFKITLKSKSGGRSTYGILAMAGSSLLYTTGSAFFHVLLISQCAYVLSSFRFKGRNFIYNLGIIIMIVPIVGSTPAMMILRRQIGIYNNMALLILTSQSTAFSGLHFLLLYAAFSRVPQTYREAVYIDGGGNYIAFFKVVLPMVVPSMVAVFVLVFLASWTDYNTYVMWLPSYPSIGYGVWLFQESATKQGISMPVVLATFVVVIVPTVALYLGTQKILMSKFTVGGLKG